MRAARLDRPPIGSPTSGRIHCLLPLRCLWSRISRPAAGNIIPFSLRSSRDAVAHSVSRPTESPLDWQPLGAGEIDSSQRCAMPRATCALARNVQTSRSVEHTSDSRSVSFSFFIAGGGGNRKIRRAAFPANQHACRLQSTAALLSGPLVCSVYIWSGLAGAMGMRRRPIMWTPLERILSSLANCCARKRANKWLLRGPGRSSDPLSFSLLDAAFLL